MLFSNEGIKVYQFSIHFVLFNCSNVIRGGVCAHGRHGMIHCSGHRLQIGVDNSMGQVVCSL